MLRLGSLRSKFVSRSGYQLLTRSVSSSQGSSKNEPASKLLLSGKLGSKLTTTVFVLGFDLI